MIQERHRYNFIDNLTGEPLKGWDLTASQYKFLTSNKKFVLFSGGYGCGKSLVLTLKAAEMAQKYPGNYILMGRKTYPELRDTLLKEFFDIVPQQYIAGYLKAEGRVIWHNGSEIIFRHLDTMAESEIRSLNLGSAFIDQAEDISKAVVDGLKGRLRRQGVGDGDRKIYMSCNPALTWLFSEFKQNPRPEYEVIEASTLENAHNLPKEYVDNLLSYPEHLKKQYVYGIWDADLLSDKVVFASEYIKRLGELKREPIKQKEGLQIFKDFEKTHRYQMGIDPAEGGEGNEISKDNASITIADLTTEEEVAAWSGQVPPDVLADKAEMFAGWYQTQNNPCQVVLEMNSVGLACLHALRGRPGIKLYQRSEYDRVTKQKLQKLGWRTTRYTKPLLVNHFQELLRLRNPQVYSAKKIEQFKTFVYSDLAKKQGMGAQEGFHDDELMSLFLAFWQEGKVTAGGVIRPEQKAPVEAKDHPLLGMRNGRVVLRGMQPRLELEQSWKV